MNLRIKDNLWTRIEWWDQLAKTDYDVVLKNIDSQGKNKDIVLSISGGRRMPQEKLVNLLDDVHVAVINNLRVFDVESWFSRSKKRTNKSAEK